MEKKPTYEVWDAVSYGYGEPLVPFSQVAIFDTLQQVQKFVDSNASVYFVLDENMNILFKTDECKTTDIV
tara:strand:+ start:264 stop:473 length:210 start_codon:yes stop_codon:yes gene_type:complete